jgi:hypothetical protein
MMDVSASKVHLDARVRGDERFLPARMLCNTRASISAESSGFHFESGVLANNVATTGDDITTEDIAEGRREWAGRIIVI